jgi:hypothetical protein
MLLLKFICVADVIETFPSIESRVDTPEAAPETAVSTKAVVANCVVFVPAVAVGAVGVPVRAGEANGAKLVATKAVVANCVVFVPAVAVGAVGTLVSAGEADKTTVPLPVVPSERSAAAGCCNPTGVTYLLVALDIILDRLL